MKILLSEEELKTGVGRLADTINSEYENRSLTIVGIMTGSIVVLADLIRMLKMPSRVGVIQTSSYQGTQRSELRINSELMPDIRGRDVLLVDDIFDTGHTLEKVIATMSQMEPRTLKSAVLLSKPGRQEVEIVPDYVGFEIPDEFVVGYGLDYEDAFRNLPYLAALEEEDIRKANSDNELNENRS